MIKDVFTLSKSAWHARLMMYIWRLSYRDFSHMCPYFWLSAFNVVIFVSFAVVKTLIQGIVAIGYKIDDGLEAFSNYIDSRIARWEDSFYATLEKDPKKWEDLYKLDLSKRCNRKYSHFIRSKLYDTDRTKFTDFWTKYNEFKWERQAKESAEEIEKTRLKQEAERIQWEKDAPKRAAAAERAKLKKARALNNKIRINSILKVVKPIMQWFIYLIASALALLALFGIFKVLMLTALIKHKFWVGLGVVSEWFLAGSSSIIMIAFIVIWCVKNIHITLGCKTQDRLDAFGIGLAKIFIFLWKIVSYLPIKLGKGIYRAIVFMGQMISDNCPAIQWKE
jgi:hypothetical protein